MKPDFTINTIPTPAMVLDGAVVRRNASRMAVYAQSHGLKLRPHTKTHKSLRVAKTQLQEGAIGLTVAKLGEAEVMAEVCEDLLLAYPALDPWRSQNLALLARRVTLRVGVDSAQAVDALADAARSAGTVIQILVDLDVGMGRTGVQSAQAALELAQHVERTGGVQLSGLMFYPGHVVIAANQQAEPLAKVAARLQETIDLWRKHGLVATIVSGGSTPSGFQSHLIPQLTEIRPGTYIYNDSNTMRGGYCTLQDCAARIICTVVSNAVPNQVVLDAGTKTLTSDLCAWARESGHGYIVEYPDAKIAKLSEEHGQVDVSKCDRRPALGERVTVIPNHICPCINLQDAAWWTEDGNLPERITIEGRGKIV